jgi:hypothetical protein
LNPAHPEKILSILFQCFLLRFRTIYPDPEDTEEQLFELLLIVRLTESWELKSILQPTWEAFCQVRYWDKRMNA